MEEQTKAVQATSEAIKELAILGQDLTKAGTELCHWFGDVLGTGPKDAVGIILTDPLAHLRVRFGAAWMDRTREILEEYGVKETKPISPDLLIETYQGASLNSDETIRELWARLMAAALDPNQEVSLNRTLIETLKQFDPVDALVFKAIAEAFYKTQDESKREDRRGRDAVQASFQLELRQTLVQLSHEKLVKIGCLGPSYAFTTLSKELWLAVRGKGAS